MLATTTTQSKRAYLKRVARNTYDTNNRVYLEAKRDHATFVVYNRYTGRTVNRVRVADLDLDNDPSDYYEGFYKSLAWAIDSDGTTPRLNQYRRKDDSYSFEWTFYDKLGKRITLCPLVQFRG